MRDAILYTHYLERCLPGAILGSPEMIEWKVFQIVESMCRAGEVASYQTAADAENAGFGEL